MTSGNRDVPHVWDVPSFFASEDELHGQLNVARIAGFGIAPIPRENTAEVRVIGVVVELPAPVLVGVGKVERLEPELNAGSFCDPGRLVQREVDRRNRVQPDATVAEWYHAPGGHTSGCIARDPQEVVVRASGGHTV